MKILLWKIGALGDVLMTTPLVRQLRAARPEATIAYLVGRTSAAALAGNPSLTQIETFDERILSAKRAWQLPGLLPRLRGYDMVFVLDKHWVFGMLASLAGIPIRIGFDRAGAGRWHTATVPYGGLQHEVCYYLDLLAAAGLPVAFDDRDLVPPTFEDPLPVWRTAAAGGHFECPAIPPPDGYVVLINAGGNNVREQTSIRKLPDGLFEAVASQCAAHRPVVFLGSRSEREYYAHHFPTGINLAGQTTLGQAAAILRNAQAVITTDNGLMHLAGAVNQNVVAIFGPTHPARKCPPGATPVWADADCYDPRYEFDGTPVVGPFFKRLTAKQILENVRFE